MVIEFLKRKLIFSLLFYVVGSKDVEEMRGDYRSSNI